MKQFFKKVISSSSVKMGELDIDSQHLPLYLKKTMSDWEFSPSSALEFGLPVDPIEENYIRPDVQGAIFSRVMPTPLKNDVSLVAYSKDVLINILNMHPSITGTKEFVDWVAGSNLLSSSTPLAHRYGGHQFGYWAMQLGDGRAISLGEFVSHNGERWDIQLKGCGLTPYSRGGDGRAVLRSSLREFLCSEAMYSLGIPTSRAAALVVSSDPVVRDPFYDGKPEVERAAIVMRIAPSWLRFGSVEILARSHEITELRQLLDYVLKKWRRYFVGHLNIHRCVSILRYRGWRDGSSNVLRSEAKLDGSENYISLLENVFRESTNLVAAWQSVGFTHGVLNTDNMSLFGITIDYGPFGFVEAYNPDFIPNTSDGWGRYAYGEQPKILLWNLQKLVVAMSPLLTDAELAHLQTLLLNLPSAIDHKIGMKFNEKLGFKEESTPQKELHALLLKIMQETKSDFTMTFRQLGLVSINQLSCQDELEQHWCLKSLSKHDAYVSFVDMYHQCMKEQGVEDEERCKNMKTKNPQYVLRNWMAQQAIAKADKNDFRDTDFLLEVLSEPFTVNEEAEKKGFSGQTPSWAKCIKVSCSS